MIIRPAKAGDLREIMDFYAMMCAELGKQDFLPEGNKGGFPPIDMVVSAIDNSELFVGEEGGQIMAAYILNNDADPAYSTVSWQITVPSEQASVLHALRVHPGFGGKGYASQLVEHAIHVAKEKNQRAVRLDCIEGNTVPHRMYQHHGVKYIDTVEICYEDIGVPRKFLLFERVL